MKVLIKTGLLSLSVLFMAGCSPKTTASNPDSFEGLPAQALAYNPKAAAVNTQLGLGYLQEGNMERAKEKMLLAQKQDPNSSDVEGALAYYYDRIGNTQQAEKFYKSALSNATSKGNSANNYGVFLCKQKRYEDANRYFMMAINDPEYIKTAEAYENLGLCSVDKGDTIAAKGYFLKALQVNPDLPNSLYGLADINFSQNKYVDAQNYLEAFLRESNPTAQSLWLGIRIADKLGNNDKESSDALMLKHNFPDSPEYQQYLAMKQA